ncbi:MAG: NAD-binding protein, partial [Gammaproteobacteria bacterium]|nr:NAD-binding protein [Gammaproteobacteria bacterium]
RYGPILQKTERDSRITAEVPSDLGDADIVVLGMGRVGKGAYERLREIYGDGIVGVEENLQKVLAHRNLGFNCVHGDASDYDFWAHSGLKDRKLVLISLTNHVENLTAVELAKELRFAGNIAVVSRFPDELEELKSLGCITFNLFGEAGHGFAEHVVDQLGLSN